MFYNYNFITEIIYIQSKFIELKFTNNVLAMIISQLKLFRFKVNLSNWNALIMFLQW